MLKRSTIFLSSTGKAEVAAVACTAEGARLRQPIEVPCISKWTLHKQPFLLVLERANLF